MTIIDPHQPTGPVSDTRSPGRACLGRPMPPGPVLDRSRFVPGEPFRDGAHQGPAGTPRSGDEPSDISASGGERADASVPVSVGLAGTQVRDEERARWVAETEARLAAEEAWPDLSGSTIPEGFRASRHQLLDALIAARVRQRTAESEQLALVSALCDAFSCLESNPTSNAGAAAHLLFGEHLRLPPSMDGVPAVAEFFGHELGPALGISPDAAWALVWDVLALRHRHPILWEHTLTGKVHVWLARKAASLCAMLPAERCRRLDADLGPLMPGWGPRKFQAEVRDARARLDPDAEQKRQEQRRSRRVEFSPFEDAEGITRLDALLDALDARHLSSTLDDLAGVLKKGGVDGTLDELRAVALGHLAHPDRAARLLQPDLLDAGACVTPDGHIVNTTSGEIVTETDRHARCAHGAQIILHLGRGDLTDRTGATVNGIGRITHQHLTEFLASCAGIIKVRPVIDLAGPMAMSVYRPSEEMIWRVKLRDGREMYPYSERSPWTTRVDIDHTVPWSEGGTTSLDNLGPCSRTTHRARTHGKFRVEQESPGRFKWTTPLGRTYWTSRDGTFTEEPDPSGIRVNQPCHTTETVLHAVLRAAATNQPESVGATVKRRARAAQRGAAERMRSRCGPGGLDRSGTVSETGSEWPVGKNDPPPF